MLSQNNRLRFFLTALREDAPEELTKEALSIEPLRSALKPAGEFFKKVAPTAGAGLGLGAVGGAGIGAVGGAVSGYRKAREEGQGMAGALASGAMGAGSGAFKGGLVGGALGAAGGAAAGHLNPQLGSALAKQENAVGKVSRFGQRQLHGLTGWTPEGGLRSIHGGAHQQVQALEGARESLQNLRTTAPEALQKARQDLSAARAAQNQHGLFTEGARAAQPAVQRAEQELAKHETAWQRSIQGAERQVANDQRMLQLSEDMERRGLTSLPGMAKALWRDPTGTLGSALKYQWGAGNGAGTWLNRGLAFGMPAATVAGAAMGPEVDQEGRGRFERAARGVMGGLAFPLMGALPAAGNFALGSYVQQPLEAVGGLMGKGVDVGAHLLQRPQ